ncbi:MAG: metal-dependent hydrolase [Marmoricola sp.]
MQPVPQRDVHVRRVHFDYAWQRPPERFPHYVDGDLVMSHVIAVLSGMFPQGEDFFVRSVRDCRDQITDPELLRQIRGFIGQEVTHGREHDVLNQQLADLGYRSMKVDHGVRVRLALVDRIFGLKRRIAITAALEHYTATLAEVLLEDPEAQRLLGGSEVRSLLLWHALEESEHKAVAFDAARAIGLSETQRIWVMRETTFTFLFLIVWHTVLSMLRDPATYKPWVLIASILRLRTSPFLRRSVIQRLRSYNRRGFHPDDWDASALIDRWKQELFDEPVS